MPELNGREAALALRAGGGPNACTPILAFSADVLQPYLDMFDGLIAKPISPRLLLKALEVHLAPATADHGFPSSNNFQGCVASNDRIREAKRPLATSCVRLQLADSSPTALEEERQDS